MTSLMGAPVEQEHLGAGWAVQSRLQNCREREKGGHHHQRGWSSGDSDSLCQVPQTLKRWASAMVHKCAHHSWCSLLH